MITRRDALKGLAATLVSLPAGIQARQTELESGLYLVSYYGTPKDGFGYELGKMITASGEIFNPNELTCAHKTLPMHTRLTVTNPRNGKKVNVRVNDRGPYIPGRELDLSYGAAKNLNFVHDGLLLAHIEMGKWC